MTIGYKKTHLGYIPTNWNIKTLDEISKIVTGSTPKTSVKEYFDGNYPWVTPSDIEQVKDIYETPRTLSLLGLLKGRELPAHTLLVTCIASIGKNAILRVKGSCNQQINAILPSANHSVDFLYYMMNYSTRRLYNLAGTTAVAIINKTSFSQFEIALPPLPEQQKIADILSIVDAKIDIIDQQIKETQELKKGLMQRLLTKGIGHTEFKDSPLGRIPKSWEVVQIQKLLDKGRIKGHLDGNHGGLYPKTDEFINEGVPYISANCFLNGRVDFTKCKHLSMERSLQFRKGVAKNGDILFAHNATVGPVAFLETDLDFVILSTTATYYRLDNKTIDAKYWMFFLSSPTFKNQYEKVMGQSTRNQVPITMQRSFYTVLPAYEEQKAISDVLNTTDNKLEVLLEKKTTFQELKKGLMQQLLTGKIRVKV